jgi:hypothetical protein
MDSILGFIVFAAIAGISAYMKHRETKQAEAANLERERQRPEDLPEETRRMLYGETGVPPKQGQAPGHDIPVARRKGAAPPMPQRRAPMQTAYSGRPAPDEMEGSPMYPRVPSEGPGSAKPSIEVEAASERQRVEDLRRQLQVQLEARKREAEIARRRAAQSGQQAQHPQQHPAQQQPRMPKQQRRTAATPVITEKEGTSIPLPTTMAAAEPQLAAEAQRPRSAVNAPAMRRILNNPRGLRQAMALNEILSPPVSMR